MHTVNAANIPSARTGGMKLKKLLPNATAVVSDVASMALAAGAYRAAKTSSEGSKIPSSSPQSSLMAALNASNISMASSHPIPMSTKGTSMLRKDTYGDADATRKKKKATGKLREIPTMALTVHHNFLLYANRHAVTSANAAVHHSRSPNTSAAASSSLIPPPACSTRRPTFSAPRSISPPSASILVNSSAHFRYFRSCSHCLSWFVA